MEEHKHQITYEVNGEPETTSEDELTVRHILEHAGFTPASDWTLLSLDPKEDFDSDYDRLVPVHEHQHFEAHHKGPVPTS
jgi:hypothetical protein